MSNFDIFNFSVIFKCEPQLLQCHELPLGAIHLVCSTRNPEKLAPPLPVSTYTFLHPTCVRMLDATPPSPNPIKRRIFNPCRNNQRLTILTCLIKKIVHRVTIVRPHNQRNIKLHNLGTSGSLDCSLGHIEGCVGLAVELRDIYS